MKLIGFTDRRHEELASPLNTLGERSKIVSASNYPIHTKYAYLLQQGRSCIHKHSPDALIANQPGRLGFVTTLLGSRYDIPTIIKLGGDLWRTNWEMLDEHKRNREYSSLIARYGQISLNQFISSRADGFLAVSNEVKNIAAKNVNCPKERIKIVHIPVDYDKFSNGDRTATRHELGFEDKRVLLTVTNLNFQGKFDGVCAIIKGIIPVLCNDESVQYVVAGGGVHQHELQQYIESEVPNCIQDQISLLGFVENVADLYAAGDLFLYFSKIDGYPNVVLEAQAAGLPVITNPDHGMVEQIEEGTNGLFVQMNNRELSQTVLDVLYNEKKRFCFGEMAQSKVRERNSPEYIGECIIDAVEDIIRS